VIAPLVDRLRARGVRLTLLDGGHVHIWPLNKVRREERELLKANKPALVALLTPQPPTTPDKVVVPVEAEPRAPEASSDLESMAEDGLVNAEGNSYVVKDPESGRFIARPIDERRTREMLTLMGQPRPLFRLPHGSGSW